MDAMDGFLLKFNRGQEHLESVEARIESFVQSPFYETVTEFDYKGRLVARVRNVQQLARGRHETATRHEQS